MSQGRYDGAVIISTKIDDAEYRRSLEVMRAESEKFARSAGKNFDSLTKNTEGLSASLAKATKVVAGLAAAYVTIDKAVSSLAVGVDYNKQLESAQLGIASIVASTFDLTDAQGKVLQGQEKFLAAQKMSVDMAKALDVASMQSTAAYTDLLSSFQTNLAPASQMGLQWQDTLDITIRMSNVLESMGLSMDTLNMETQRLLTGNDLIHSQIAKRLGLTREEIKSWGTGAQYMENFNKRFEAFVYSGAAAEKTLSAVSAFFTDTMQSLSAEVGKGLFESLKKSMLTVADAFYEIDEATKTFQIVETMQPLVQLGQDIVSAFGSGLENAASGFVNTLETLSGLTEEYRGTLDALGSGISTVTSNWHVAAGAVAAYTLAQKAAQTEAGKYLALLYRQREGNLVILGGVEATKQRAAADREASLAAQQLAAARLAAAKSDYAALYGDAAKEGMASSRNLAEQQAAAWTRVAVAEKALAVANLQVAATTNTLNAAQKAATVTARAKAAATTLLAVTMKGLRAILASINPAMLAITALGAGIAYLMGRQSEAEKVAEKYSDAVARLKGSAKEAADGLEALQKRIASLSKSQAEAVLFDAKKDLKAFEEQLDDFFANWNNEAASGKALALMEAGILGVAQQFYAAEISAAEFRDAVEGAYGSGKLSGKFRDELLKIAAGMGEARDTTEAAQKQIDSFAAGVSDAAGVTAEAAASTGKLADALKKLDQEFDDVEGAFKFMDKLTKSTKEGEKASIEHAKAEAKRAMALIESEIATHKAAAATALFRAQQLNLANDNGGALKALKEYADAMDLVTAASTRLEAYKKGMAEPGFKWTGGAGQGSGKKPSEYIAEIRKEIVELGRDGGKLYLDELDDALTRIAKSGKEAGVGLKAIGALQKEYKEAFAAAKVREFADALAELEGRGSEVFMRKMAEEARHYEKALIDSGMSAEEAAAQIERFKRASALKVEEGNLETVVNFLKEMSELSGDAALGIEEQNRLLEIQAEILRNNLPPALQGLVDKWLELKKAQMDQSWLGGAKQAINQYTQEWTNAGKIAQKQTEALIGTLQGVTSSAIDALFDGTEFRVDQLFRDLAKQLANILMNQMWAAILGGLFGGGGGGVLGGAKSTWNAGKSLAGGGYTGNAPINKVTGIVHGQEYVLNAATTKSIGVTTLNAINSGKLKLSSFASSSNLPTSGMLTVGRAAPIVNVNIHTPPGMKAETEKRPNASGGFDMTVFIEQVDNAMAAGIASGRSKTAQAIGKMGRMS